MTEAVARALCHTAGRPHRNPDCPHCENGKCELWPTFLDEARAAIWTAYRWHKVNRRWPSFVKDRALKGEGG